MPKISWWALPENSAQLAQLCAPSSNARAMQFSQSFWIPPDGVIVQRCLSLDPQFHSALDKVPTKVEFHIASMTWKVMTCHNHGLASSWLSLTWMRLWNALSPKRTLKHVRMQEDDPKCQQSLYTYNSTARQLYIRDNLSDEEIRTIFKVGRGSQDAQMTFLCRGMQLHINSETLKQQ